MRKIVHCEECLRRNIETTILVKKMDDLDTQIEKVNPNDHLTLDYFEEIKDEIYMKYVDMSTNDCPVCGRNTFFHPQG